MRVGSGDRSTDDADVCVASGQCATRGPKWSRCVSRCGYGCLRGVYVCTCGLDDIQTQTQLEGLFGWYDTIDPPVCSRFQDG
jgi:hypothetical protein